MNSLQKIEFDMLKEVIRICEELNLRYYLVCGSALGAAKYSGFIPWDDDMDVGIFREDYEIFLQKAQEMLPNHLFLQNYHTDIAFPHVFSKIRNSNTTFIEKSVADLPINHGIYIDIFPLDGYPKDGKYQLKLERKKRSLQKKLSCVFTFSRSKKAMIGMYFRRMLGYHRTTVKILEEYTQEIARYTIKDSDIICNHGNWQGKLEYAPKEQYGKGTMVKFEGLTVRIPEDYDAYLTQKYGDWRADLPEEEQKGHHNYEICDLNHSYVDYIEKLPNGKIRLKKSSNITKDI